MDTYRKARPNQSDQIKQSQKRPCSVDENQEPEKNYLPASSELDLLKKHIKNLKHDLRSPLSGISGMLEMMINEDKDRIEVRTGDLLIIKEAIKSLLDLINGALVNQDTRNNRKEGENIDRNLSSVIMEINRLYLPMALNKNILLSVNNQTKSEIQLQNNFFINLIQITGNLVANAIKFTPPNGFIDVVFSLDSNEDNKSLNMTIVDTGKSMSPDHVSAFNQGKPIPKSMGTNGEAGFGIGLQHIRKMVSNYAGQIFVKSRKGSGTTFSISFPIPASA